MSPLFSIVVPVYRSKEVISRCISSCLDQDFEDLEVVIVDDCGNDGSLEIIEELRNNDDRIRVFVNSYNLGPFDSRVVGALKSRGEYLIFLDADDALSPDSLTILHDLLKAHPVQAVTFGLKIIGSSHEKYLPPYFLGFRSRDNLLSAVFCTDKSRINYNLANGAYKRSVFLESLCLRPEEIMHVRSGEDLFQLFLFYLVANSAVGLDAPLYYYYSTEDSITNNISVNNINKRIYDHERLKLALNDERFLACFQKFPDVLRRLNALYCYHNFVLKAVISSYAFNMTRAILVFPWRWQNILKLLAYVGTCGFVRR